MKGVKSDGKKTKKMDKMILAGLSGGNILEVCRDYGIAQTQYYQWRETFLQGGQNALATGINTKEQELEKELEAAKKLIGDRPCRLEFCEDGRETKGN